MTYDRQAQIRDVHAQRRKATEAKANAAIDSLLTEKKAVNFRKVSERSGVSVSTLYKHEQVAERIRYLRDSEKALPSSRDAKRNMSDSGKDAVIASLKRKVASLEAENRKLREAAKKGLADEWKDL